MEKNQVKLSIQGKDREIHLVTNGDNDIHEMFDEFCNLLIAWGYHPETVQAGILSKSAQYEDAEVGENEA